MLSARHWSWYEHLTLFVSVCSLHSVLKRLLHQRLVLSPPQCLEHSHLQPLGQQLLVVGMHLGVVGLWLLEPSQLLDLNHLEQHPRLLLELLLPRLHLVNHQASAPLQHRHLAKQASFYSSAQVCTQVAAAVTLETQGITI